MQHIEKNGGSTASIERLIDINAVREQTGLGRSKLYNLIAKGMFPKQIKIGVRAARWLESEVQGWIKDCVAARSEGGV